ncbi:MAG: 4'-phosphopantetheinyl transferase superfamily protein [Bacteroidetes bacterium]|nr:4'-phosphopantetheinyl transferase superfamily protein [Bacteroidota bacterium]
MIFYCYTEIGRQWNEHELTDKLILLPEDLRRQALKKRRWIDRQLSIAGKLLLLEVLKQLPGGRALSLEDLKYNKHQRPYFNADIDFNIAHSGNMVICCATNSGKIGVDIEQVKEIHFDEYSDYFTRGEWAYINRHANKLKGFFKFWTRKEAVLKAAGTGFDTHLLTIDVSEDHIIYDDVHYHIVPLDIDRRYHCHIAFTREQDKIKTAHIELQ